MSDNTLQKRVPSSIKEKGQYVLTFGVIAIMLYALGFPFFVIFFLGVLSWFIWRMFSSASRLETRRIFEFYLAANEILREDERRWFGFEIQEAIAKGEAIVRSMSAVPPLVYFALGALNHKIGDHAAAVKNLSNAIEDPATQEFAIVFPTGELRSYVNLLRKIEREPAEAPLTAAAIRALERLRKNHGKRLLEESRARMVTETAPQLEADMSERGSFKEMVRQEETTDDPAEHGSEKSPDGEPRRRPLFAGRHIHLRPAKHQTSSYSDRKPITEVLHDIYDENVQ